jgi:hypothetical protein
MPDTILFIGVAQQYGYGAKAAELALKHVRTRLEQHNLDSSRFYLFRTGGGGVGSDTTTMPPARTRTLLAFSSADAALAFAQSYGLGAAPRLLSLSLPQMLAVLVQRPTIRALLVAGEHDAIGPDGLPDGIRIEREGLLAQLAHTEPTWL